MVSAFRQDCELKILIVGVKDGNFPPAVADNPRIILRYSTKPQDVRREDVPRGVGLVVFLRFVSHSQRLGVTKAAKARGVPVIPTLKGTHAVQRVLVKLFPECDFCGEEPIQERAARVLAALREVDRTIDRLEGGALEVAMLIEEMSEGCEGESPLVVELRKQFDDKLVRIADLRKVLKIG